MPSANCISCGKRIVWMPEYTKWWTIGTRPRTRASFEHCRISETGIHMGPPGYLEHNTAAMQWHGLRLWLECGHALLTEQAEGAQDLVVPGRRQRCLVCPPDSPPRLIVSAKRLTLEKPPEPPLAGLPIVFYEVSPGSLSEDDWQRSRLVHKALHPGGPDGLHDEERNPGGCDRLYCLTVIPHVLQVADFLPPTGK